MLMADQTKKKYLILTFNVCNLGGGQLYVLRRAKYLKTKGYDIHIVVTFHTNYFPLEENFKDFSLYVIPEMGRPSATVSKSKVNLLISDILNKVGVSTELLIETHTLETIEWGELIASQCGAKHLAYPLAEPKVSKYKFNPGVRIFWDKLRTNSFYGCTSTSLKQIFEENTVPANYVNIGYDENEMIEKCEPSINYSVKNGDYVITTVTRLDKTYVEPLVESTVQLAKKYSHQKFVLLIAGGSKTKGREDYLFSNFSNEKYKLPNLNILYTGYIEKLGKDIFNLSNVFVGMGTASINAISQRCLTINIDPNNGMKFASGFFGEDTCNFAYSESGKIFTISEKLEEAYLLSDEEIKQRKEKSRKLYENEFETLSCFKKIDLLFDNILPSVINKRYEISNFYRIHVQTLTGIKKMIHSILCFFQSHIVKI